MEDLDLSYLQHCDNRSSTDPLGAPNAQPIEPKIINRPENVSDATWNAFLRTMNKNGTSVEAIQAAEEKRKANPIVPEWMKEPEHNPAIQAPAKGELYNIRLDASQFQDSGSMIEANRAVQAGLRAANVPTALAGSLVDACTQSQRAAAGKSQEQLADHFSAEYATLQRAYGEAKALEMSQKAQQVFSAIGAVPGAVSALGEYAGHSAASIVAAANIADLLAYRKAK